MVTCDGHDSWFQNSTSLSIAKNCRVSLIIHGLIVEWLHFTNHILIFVFNKYEFCF